jgi:DtxR family Mn-dependent transcriptional regulator
MTESLEDYLEMISLLCENGQKRITDVAREMNVSKPSVIGAIKTLADAGLATHKPYGEIALTEAGEEKAKEIREKHAFLAKFLHEVVGVARDVAERDACKMEHILSPETLSKLKVLSAKNLKPHV